MRASQKGSLEKVETGIFQYRLKQETARQVNLNFEQLVQKYRKRHEIYEEKVTELKKKGAERQFYHNHEYDIYIYIMYMYIYVYVYIYTHIVSYI